MFDVPLASSTQCLQPNQFWSSVILYYSRPNIVNRKLVALSTALICKVQLYLENIDFGNLITKATVLYEARKLHNLSKENLTIEFIKNLILPYDRNAQIILSNDEELRKSSTGTFVSVRILFPKLNKSQPYIEVVVCNKTENKAMFVAVEEEKNQFFSSTPFPYEIKLSLDFKLSVNINTFEEADTNYADWLADKLFPKLINWALEDKCDENVIQSLSLISADEYCLTYKRLKEKYGDKLVKEWPTKTGTDPQKFVFEDIAIASYLICLWNDYDKSEINFVDCGCGNGLLVHLLNEEGYAGYGIDVRRRLTWDMFPETTRLEVGTITPSSIFPESTWIIGNHSDELTPWIPVISINSSINTNFFVLPCCAYDFSGQKYIRMDTSMSTYTDYLNYIRKICEMCGFDTSVDKLRIPSTKRTCLVGIRKKCSIDERDTYCKEIKEFIKKRSENTTFAPRSDIEKVKNCTQLNRDLISKLVQICVNKMLKNEVNIIFKQSGEEWNRGGCALLSELASAITSEDLKQLKKECGGLQTLLRNHRYIFELSNGKVMLRLPVQLVETSKYKSKPCWFFKNHPNGCLYDESSCGYSH